MLLATDCKYMGFFWFKYITFIVAILAPASSLHDLNGNVTLLIYVHFNEIIGIGTILKL